MSSQNLMQVIIIIGIIDNILETHHQYIPKCKLITQYNSNVKALYVYTKYQIREGHASKP